MDEWTVWSGVGRILICYTLFYTTWKMEANTLRGNGIWDIHSLHTHTHTHTREWYGEMDSVIKIRTLKTYSPHSFVT